MTHEPSEYQKTKDAIARRQRMSMLALSALAVLMVGGGLLLVFLWAQDAVISLPFLATKTPTPTQTYTPSPTPEPSATPTQTVEPSPTVPENTATAAAPFIYIVESGDTIISIAEKFDVLDYLIIIVMNNLESDALIVGQQLIIPDPNTGMPDPTPIPANLPAGSVIIYRVLPGDSVRSIAEQFLSTEDAIIEENELADPNLIYPGQLLRVPIRLVTPTTAPLNSGTTTPASGSTITPVPSGPSATPTP